MTTAELEDYRRSVINFADRLIEKCHRQPPRPADWMQGIQTRSIKRKKKPPIYRWG